MFGIPSGSPSETAIEVRELPRSIIFKDRRSFGFLIMWQLCEFVVRIIINLNGMTNEPVIVGFAIDRKLIDTSVGVLKETVQLGRVLSAVL